MAARCGSDIIARVTPQAFVIRGHGLTGGRTQLVGFRDILVGVRDTPAAPKEAGPLTRGVVATKATRVYDQKWMDSRCWQGVRGPGARRLDTAIPHMSGAFSRGTSVCGECTS